MISWVQLMTSIRSAALGLTAFCFLTVAAQADVISYNFSGVDNTVSPADPEAFTVSLTGFLNPVVNGSVIAFSCAQLLSNVNCSSPGITFGIQSVLGSFADQLQFDSFASGTVYDFPTSAFNTVGTYHSQTGQGTVGTLIVTDLTTNPVSGPEPSSWILMLSTGGLLIASFRKLKAAIPK
jgi:hypothetical protein